MKVTKLNTDNGPAIGIVHDMGRIEHLDSTNEHAIDRLVDCANACEGLSDASMKLMANGGTQAGNLVERTVAWSLFFSYNPRMARTFLDKARAEIAKLNGDPV